MLGTESKHYRYDLPITSTISAYLDASYASEGWPILLQLHNIQLRLNYTQQLELNLR